MSYAIADLLVMPQNELFEIMRAAIPLDPNALANTSYTGIDLSMPAIFHRLFWKTFRKTFHRDPRTGVLRGWNVKVHQTGWETPPEPKRDRHGHLSTFGHYELRSAHGLNFPRDWRGEHYLDYHVAGNTFTDFPARAGFCPLVAVNPGNSDLLLGWEIFKLGSVFIPLPDFWILQREGPLNAADVIPRPC